MICSLSGVVSGFCSGAVEIEVQGVGYTVNVPLPLLAELRLGQNVRILTHMVVREDAMSLYGFTTGEQKEMFLSLMGVNGVGPKLALAITGIISPSALRNALATGDRDLLQSVPGVGKRGAERIMVELKGRLGVTESDGENQSRRTEVRDALVALGYSPAELREVLDKTLSDSADSAPVEDLVKAALKELAQL